MEDDQDDEDDGSDNDSLPEQGADTEPEPAEGHLQDDTVPAEEGVAQADAHLVGSADGAPTEGQDVELQDALAAETQGKVSRLLLFCNLWQGTAPWLRSFLSGACDEVMPHDTFTATTDCMMGHCYKDVNCQEGAPLSKLEHNLHHIYNLCKLCYRAMAQPQDRFFTATPSR